MRLPRQLRLLLLTAAFLVVAAFLLYQKFYPRFDYDDSLELVSRSCEIPRIYWPGRAMRVHLVVNSPATAVDVYVLRSDNRQDDEVVEQEGKRALSGSPLSGEVLASERGVQTGTFVFSKPESVSFRVLLVNPSEKQAHVKIELWGR